uniref:Reverse transcriptase n=1 Tax=Anopheles gambiae TaxID=7165 RepID=Q868S0_ANOGA|nr:reverse transcriptase [Anopheles gambiae]
MVRLLQHNQNHSYAAFQLMWQTIREESADIVLIADPYLATTNVKVLRNDDNTAAVVVNADLPVKVVSKALKGLMVVDIGDMRVVSVYAPPRFSMEEFQIMLDNTVMAVTGIHKFVIGGDFNAWSASWNNQLGERGETQKRRGELVLSTFAQIDAILLNDGSTPTYVGPGRTSVVDLTFASRTVARSFKWEVLSSYMNSDHRAIRIDLETQSVRNLSRPITGWSIKYFSKDIFEVMMQAAVDTEVTTSEDLMRILVTACNATMTKRKRYTPNKSAFWWTLEIEALRKECKHRDRLAQRAFHTDLYSTFRDEFKVARNALKRLIKHTRQRKWKEFLGTANNASFGIVYHTFKKVAEGSIGPRTMTLDEFREVVSELFPTHPNTVWPDYRIDQPREFERITNDEILAVARRLPNKKAPGPDGIPNEALKVGMLTATDAFCRVYQGCLENAKFPDEWKRQRLVLIPKPNKPPGEPGSVRPICLLDGAGKGLERIIVQRLNAHIEEVNGLSDDQFGFRSRRSTVDAIQRVVDIVSVARSRNRYSGRYCAVVTLDVTNAFNSASWLAIANALQRINTPKYLYDIIGDYFRNRVLMYDTTDGPAEIAVTSGVPQGSVLGPTLWNLMYDGVLRVAMVEGARIIGYADDIVLLVEGNCVDDIEILVSSQIRIIDRWMTDNGLKIAPTKTEFIMVSSHQRIQHGAIRVGDHVVHSSRTLKYLGMVLDDRLEYTSHIRYAVERATKLWTTLVRMMPNKAGPSSNVRRVIALTVVAKVRYASPIWCHTLRFANRRQWLRRFYRPVVQRVISSFRTTSHDAVCVLAGMIPLHLLLDEDSRTFHRRRAENIAGSVARNMERVTTMERWQREWDESVHGRWTYRLIPDVNRWISRRFGGVDFFLSQFLSSHGFYAYQLHRMQLTGSPLCDACEEPEDAEHTIFHCVRHRELIIRLQHQVDEELTPENIIEVMSANRYNWSMVHQAVRTIMIRQQHRRHVIERGERRALLANIQLALQSSDSDDE